MYGHLNDIFDSHIVRLDIQVVQKSFPKTEILTIVYKINSNESKNYISFYILMPCVICNIFSMKYLASWHSKEKPAH